MFGILFSHNRSNRRRAATRDGLLIEFVITRAGPRRNVFFLYESARDLGDKRTRFPGLAKLNPRAAKVFPFL